MLKKTNRISYDKEFDRVFKSGQSFYGQVLGVRAAINERAETRAGILVSTKVSKKAVIRNRLKRQIREIFFAELPKLKSGYDLVIIVLPRILDKNFQEIETVLGAGFKALKLYK